jgi:hypothetical protein
MTSPTTFESDQITERLSAVESRIENVIERLKALEKLNERVEHVESEIRSAQRRRSLWGK